LGGTTKIKTLKGEELEIFVQPGTECGSTKTIPGMGFSTGGNLVITFRIEVPKNPSGKLKKLLTKLAKELKEEGVEKPPTLLDNLKKLLP
jgi:molecular chaperone DnaJ